MGHRFADIAFTPGIREIQRQQGSRDSYARMDQGEDYNHRIGPAEAEFIAARDSFYMASVSETGWPYLQHRGGKTGFVKVLGPDTLGFADYSGNRQYISTGNLQHDDRVALFFMDYPNQRRLKLLGRVQLVGLDQSETMSRLEDEDYQAQIERGMLIRVEAFDWNCPQHITPRYSEAELEVLMAPLQQQLDELRQSQPISARVADTDSVTQEVVGEGDLELVISGVRQLTPRVRAYELRATDGASLPEVEAGAHLPVPVPLSDDSWELRYYSIASNPKRRDIYEIAVLHEPDGKGGSDAIHRRYRLGLRLRVGLPGNHFRLHTDTRPAVLIAGGIGITPIKAMAQALQSRGAEFQLHYAGRSRVEMAYADRLQRSLGERLYLYPADESLRLDLNRLLRQAPDEALFYCCGPNRLLDALLAEAKSLGISTDRVRVERFAAGQGAADQPVLLELAKSGRQLEVAADQTLLDALLEAEVDIPHSCRTGQCRSCAVKVLAGEADHRDQALTQSEQQRLICPCVSRAKTPSLMLDL
ncbi:pyridoxamine 5'-phosphate oxidase [Motiliproteus coralliicola]|uniref:Pyridoxamine 5'-phosphate oxidase n=1 Tax=Motiliproteus coralliicola TaxID=2283196 RepID=A0A369WSF4_9GAMM|nr:2Fe-2S iron-sulfur cluster-binding protein [Motiliproteus coralliicola]RDE24612.1 pyridoxamine 5'-phosphate oxidase [Motiliproteus coralliicola]